MSQTVIKTDTLKKFDKLADLLEKASSLAREISQGQTNLPTRKLTRPKNIPKDEKWFWSIEWQNKESEVDKALAEGEYKDLDNIDDLIAELHSHV